MRISKKFHKVWAILIVIAMLALILTSFLPYFIYLF